MKTVIFFILALMSSGTMDSANAMTQEEVENNVITHGNLIERKKGYVVFRYKNVRMVLISDVTYDRMRIIAPITKYASLTPAQKDMMMESNFHRALDARYAASRGVLYSAFIHPMSPLTKKQLDDALNQVSTLALTFGGSYSGGSLSFGDTQKSPTDNTGDDNKQHS